MSNLRFGALVASLVVACGGGGDAPSDSELATATTEQAVTGQDGTVNVTGPGTVLNQYAVLAADVSAGDTTVTVTSAAAFTGSSVFPGALAAGDLIMLYQPMGASISVDDNDSYGAIGALLGAGNYELVHVASVAGTTINLEATCGGLEHAYTTAGRTQVIRVPQAAALTFTGAGASLVAQPWDGQIGGVVAMHVQGTATIGGAGISATGRGFRGGAVEVGSATGSTEFVSLLATEGAQKGESIAGDQGTYTSTFLGDNGRGAPANGGGGGNMDGAPGGGGANGDSGTTYTGHGVMDPGVVGAIAWEVDPAFLAANPDALATSAGGGRGGYSRSNVDLVPEDVPPGDPTWGADSRRVVGGRGGHPLTNDPANRLFMGGGGGAGAALTLGGGGAGGAGGGLVVLIANAVDGSGNISASGAAGGGGTGDGPGGGGGGGSIIIKSNSLTGVALRADGGVGGQHTAVLTAVGGGGGGGGGFIAVSAGTPTRSAAGGNAGTTTSDQVDEFPVNGATKGAAGQATASASGVLPVCTAVDLSITKTNGVTSSTPGTATTYTIVATNNGDDFVVAATVADTFAAALVGPTWSCVATPGSSCPTGTISGNINNPVTLAPGGTATFTVNATISAAATGNLVNTATITAPAGITEINAGNNSATDTDTLTPSANLAIAISDTPDPVVANANITYGVVVSNAGPSNTGVLTVTGDVPANATFVSAGGSGGWTCSQAAGTITCTHAAIAIGNAQNLPIVLRAPVEADTVNFTVDVASTTTDPVLGNNTATATTTVNARADLAIAMTDTPDPVIAGGTLTYAITVTNNGRSTAPTATVTDVLPGNVTFVSATGTGWSCSGTTTVTCTHGPLATGPAQAISIVVTAPASGSISNTATVATTAGLDTVNGNNSATATTTVTTSADLSITKTDSADPVVAGAQFTYTLAVTNNGPSSATGIQVVDNLPVGVGFVSASGGGFTCTQASGTVTCNRASALANGGTASITLTVTAPANGTNLSNTATVTATTADPDNGNNSATETTAVTSSANLAIALADSPDPVNAGATLTYTITPTNAGPSTAADVTVTDVLPATVTFGAFTTLNGWTCDQAAGTITCTRAALAAGANVPIVFTVTAPTAGGTITNSATIASATTADPNTANNAASINTAVNARADLSIAVVDSPDPVATGASLTYEIQVSNAGPSDVATATMVNTLPNGVVFVSVTANNWSCVRNLQVVTCTRTALGVGDADPITIATTAPLAAGSISNTATVSSTPNIESANGNNTAITTTQVTPSTDLEIVAVDVADPIEAGASQVYTVDVENKGPITATNARVTSTLPDGLVFASSTGDGWTCTAAGQALTCTQATLAVGPAPQLAITTTADASSGTIVTTLLTVGSDFGDAVQANNTVSLDTLIIDREIDIVANTVFDDTFRNPGPAAPIRAIAITNTGDALLHVTSVTLDTVAADVWTLLDTAPQDIPAGATAEYRVRFAPTTLGVQPTATVTIASDDRSEPTTTVTFSGTGIDRGVAFSGPQRIDIGFTGIGVPVTIDDALVVQSSNASTTFAISRIDIVDDPACETSTTTANAAAFSLVEPPVGDPLPAGAQVPYDLRFTSTTAGRFTAAAQLFVDPDGIAQATVCLEGEAVFVDARGGGGCSTGGDVGGGALLGLGAFGMLLRRRRRALIGAIALAAGPASADKLAISVFDPTPATTGTNFQLQSADVGHTGDYVISATFSHATDPLVLDGGVDGQAQVIQRSTLMLLGGAFAFLDRFEAGARVPLYLQDGAAAGDRTMMFTADPASGAAMGDITLHGKVRVYKHGGAALGAGLQLTIPTAAEDSFTGTEKPSLRAIAIGSLTPDTLEHRIALTGHFGGVARAKSEFANISQGSGMTWGVGASVRALDRMWLSAEMFGDLLPSARKATATTGAVSLSPIEWLAGLRYAPDHRFNIGLAFGRGLTAAAGSPSLRGVLELSYAPRAPELRPIRIPTQPKPDLDADGDGIRDSVDKCPNEPEDLDLFDDSDGCPDLDNDKDGVADAIDKCPIDPEDVDKFEDTDGCPDKDNDGDGIADAADKCPTEAEDKDGFNDVDGCPDPDNDLDGIPDAKDKCPLEPETINGTKDDDGCADPGDTSIVLSPDRIETLDSIAFDRGTKVQISRASFNVLGQVGATMRAHTEIVRLRVTAHVHPSGNYEKDQELSDKRAQAIRDWLVQYGIAPSRVESRGFGSSKTLAPENQKGASDVNNRVELIILERK